MTRKNNDPLLKNRRWLLGGGLTLCLLFGVVTFAYPAFHKGRIYPGVSAQGVALGGMTPEEARSVLSERLSAPSTPAIRLRGDEDTWQLDGPALGGGVDWVRTAEAAYRAGRRGSWHHGALAAWGIRFRGLTINTQTTPLDAGHVRAQVDAIANQVYAPPTNASVHISPSGLACSPGAAGRALNVEATIKSVMNALANGESEVALVTVDLPPDVAASEPGCAQARSLLSRPFTLVADDPLTYYEAVFEAPPESLADWVRAVAAGDKVLLEIEESGVEAWLLEIAPQIGPERILDVERTLARALAALRAGEHEARSVISHPPQTYVVQPGDTLFDIAYENGFPQWRLEEANPDLTPDELLIGMELTIPSIDVLFPEPLVPGKRIEIDLPEQRLRAYEGEELVYDFTSSSGMTRTPTIAGQFQILFKEPQAYAQRWSLEMPYFMAIYYERPDFANGIHELPIGANGQRLWASVLGWPASYGCIILDVSDAEKLYDWAPVGTLVRIEGVAPGTPAYVPTYDDQDPSG